MKKTIIGFISLIIISCSGDDNETTTNEASIYGKWFHKEIVVNTIVFPYDDHEPCGKDYIEFYDQDKIRSIDVWACEEDIDWIGTFIKVNNTLTVSNGNESRTVEIIELNSNSLIYQYEFDEDDDGTVEHYIEKFYRE